MIILSWRLLLILFLILFILTTCQTLTIIFPAIRKILGRKNNIFVQIMWVMKQIIFPVYGTQPLIDRQGEFLNTLWTNCLDCVDKADDSNISCGEFAWHYWSCLLWLIASKTLPIWADNVKYFAVGKHSLCNLQNRKHLDLTFFCFDYSVSQQARQNEKLFNFLIKKIICQDIL